jgi:hypothetical protein
MLSVKARSADVAVEYRGPTSGPAESLWLPFEFLADCEGKRDEPVHIEATGKGRCTAQWRDGSVPQLVQYRADVPADAGKFPMLPENFVENPSRLLQALVDASDTTDPDSTRFALGCIQARPDGSLGATDGRQLLVQSGFTFPWQEALLIPRSKVFGSPELPHDQPVFVGKTGDWVAMQAGAWTIYLAANKDGRFPDVGRQIPQPADATARCQLSAADAEFLAQTLPRLPCDDTYNDPVTVELNGNVAIRARAADQSQPTEVMLTGSSWSGEPVRLNMNRRYLARAVKLGLREFCVYSNKAPVLCQDEYRQYVWALLDPESTIGPAKDAIRIESPDAGQAKPISSLKPQRKASIVSETPTNPNDSNHAPTSSTVSANGHATKTNGRARKAAGRKSEQHDTTALIEQAEELRTVLHDVLLKTNDLVKALKQHQRQNRVIQSTLDSIRQLKGLGV